MIKLQNERNMRNQLLFPLLLLLAAHIAQAQCDPKLYARIFSEAQALQEQGQFIEAKNKYEHPRRETETDTAYHIPHLKPSR